MNNQPAAIGTLNQHFLLDYPAEAAAKIEQLPVKEVAEILTDQPVHVLRRLWPHLLPDTADKLLPLLEESRLQRLLLELDPSQCINQLNRLDEDDRQRSLALLPESYQQQLQQLMTYPPNSAGHLMDLRILIFRPEMTVSQALEKLRQSRDSGRHQIVLSDSQQYLNGIVEIQDIALAEPDTLLSDIARPARTTISPFDTGEEVADRMKQFNLELLPVLDINQRLIGVIRHAALIKALQQESASDIQTMVGVSKDERALSPVWFSVRKRLPWMQINLATAFLAAAVVGLFEDTIARFTALAVLLPVVAGQSGNAGAQAQAVTIRGLALREITVRNWFRVMFKELNVGFFNGIAIALTTAVGVYLWSKSAGLALVICIAMIISMVAAGVAGSVIPIMLTRLGQDPAQSSSILLTTVTDVAGFLSFLGIATLLATLL